MVRYPSLLSIAILTDTTTDSFAPSMLPARIQTKASGAGSGLVYRAQPPSPLKPKDGESTQSDEYTLHSKQCDSEYDSARTAHKVDATGGRGGNGKDLTMTTKATTTDTKARLSIFTILWQYFGMVTLFVSVFQLILTTLSTITVKQCLTDAKYDAPPGAFLPESCAFEKFIPFLLIYLVNIGLYYVNLYGMHGKTKGWLVLVLSGGFFVSWMVIGFTPDFLHTRKIYELCTKYSSMSTANKSNCSKIAVTEMLRRINLMFWNCVIATVAIDRLRKAFNIIEPFRFLIGFTWSVISAFMISLIVPVLNDQRGEDISVLIIRFLYMPMTMLIADLAMRVLARTFPKAVESYATTVPTHAFRALYFLELRVLLMKLESIGPIVVINFAMILKDLVSKVGLRDPMVYVYRFSYGDEKSELLLTTKSVRQQRVIEQISAMSCDYAALFLMLTVTLMGKAIDKDGKMISAEDHMQMYAVLIACQVVADMISIIIDIKIHKYDYSSGWRAYLKSKLWITHLSILVMMVPILTVTYLSHFCFDVREGGPGFGLKGRSYCPMTHNTFSERYLTNLMP